MDFAKLLSLASKKQKTSEKSVTAPKRYDTSIPPPTREVKKKPAGVKSAAVQAFLEKKEREQKEKELAEKRKAEKSHEFMQQYVDTKKHAKGAKGIVVNIKAEEKKPERFRVPKISKDNTKSSKNSETNSESKVSTKITTKLIHPSARKSNSETQPLARKTNSETRPSQDNSRHKSAKDRPSQDNSRHKSAKDRPGVFASINEKHSKEGRSSSHGFKKDKDSHSGADSRKASGSVRTKDIDTRTSGGNNKIAKSKINVSKEKPKIVKRAHQSSGKGPMSFEEILKLAQNKDKNAESAVPALAATASMKKPKDIQLPGRPMTGEEKEHFLRKQTREYQERFYGKGPSGNSKTGSVTIKDSSLGAKSAKSQSMSKVSAAKASPMGKVEQKTNGAMLKNMLEKPKMNSMPNLSNSGPGGKSAPSGGRMMPQQKRELQYAETRENVLVCRPASSGPNNSDEEPEGNLSAWDRIYKKMNKNRPVKRKMEEQDLYGDEYGDEDEDDDELDDFIDDEPTEEQKREGPGYSQYIREIFGYDKRKFRHERDDDVDNMETNFASQMKEEARSARLGRLEDAEDIAREERDLKRKKSKKMKKR